MPSVQSSLHPAAQPTRGTGRSSTQHHSENKENERSRQNLANSTDSCSRKAAANTGESDEDDDGTYGPPEDDHSQDDIENDGEDKHEARDANPVRGRVRRVSDKQAQRDAEKAEAEARKHEKALKVAKAAKKRAGQVEEDPRGPIEDDFFTSRTVPSRPLATKNLVQRNNRVPVPPKAPSADWDEATTSARHRDRRSHNDNSHRTTTRSVSPEEARHTFRGRSPLRSPVREPIRNINGRIVPDKVTLHLGQNTYQDHEHVSHAPRHHSFPRSISPPHRSRPRSKSPARRICSPTRSLSPEAGEKHSRSSSAESDGLRPAQAQRVSASSGRPRAKDLDERTREYVMYAISLYRCYISAESPFPDSSGEHGLIMRVWEMTCTVMGKKMVLTPTVAKLITNRGPQVRGELKTKIKPLVELNYGFKSGQDKKTIAFNRKLAEKLKEGSAFAFKHVKEKRGLYKNPILQMAVNAMWFANRRDEGPRHPDIFGPQFPRQAAALVLAVVENTIDEHVTGIKTDVPFTANDYRSVYESHLKALNEFAEYTAEHKILDKILTRMHTQGRFHSGAQPLATISKAAFSQKTLDDAIRENEEGSTTEDDTEPEDGAGAEGDEEPEP
ncbi:hypothetical protein B0H15DRAFT_948698 [Mycena belliarum]|uniref:DUF6532 domain-containing protein n=1 Tax=Mycena belliarum TaxID=1033014 RepID=A0AAD6XRZ7_9AGAR|nr:hypothetical protein B0H15DRAFT_948698 [Mycena belliae]